LRVFRLTSAGAVLVSVIVYALYPAARPTISAVIGVTSVAAISYGVTKMAGARRVTWVLIGVAVALVAIGDVCSTVAGGKFWSWDYPRPQDLFYLAAYVPLTVGVLWSCRSRVATRDWAMVLDTVVLSLAGSLLFWHLLVRPALIGLDLSAAAAATLIGSWVGFVVLLAASPRLAVAWRTDRALGLLSLGLVLFLVSDVLYNLGLLHGQWTASGPADLGFVAFSALAGAAALLPRKPGRLDEAQDPDQPGLWRLLLVAAALLVAPTILFVEAISGPVTTGLTIAVVSAAAGIAVVMRLSLAVVAYQRRAARDRAVWTASRTLVEATTEDQVTDGLAAALDSVLPPAAPRDVRLVNPADPPPGGAAPGRGDSERGAVGNLVVAAGNHSDAPISGADHAPLRQLVFSAPTNNLMELSPTLENLGDQAGLALDRIQVLSRSRVEERERYFRTLVLTSVDVTLISRGGRVEYATPSAETMFGHNPVGWRFDDLVYRDQRRPAVDRGWSDREDGAEGYVRSPQGRALTVVVHRRDLTQDAMVSGVVSTLRDVTNERDLQRDLAHRATHDALTGLANTELFDDALRAASSCQDQGAVGWAVLFIDLDDFKEVNDTYGHEAGDELLIETARRVTSCLRHDDLAARLGGDEFAVLMRGVPDTQSARAMSQRLAERLARPATVAGALVDCQASIGLSHASTTADVESLLVEADQALYTAKAVGKGQWREYHESLPVPTRRKVEIRRQLRTAIESGSLRLLYQPIVEIVSGTVVGFEALIRDAHDKDPAMSAQEIIDAAEETGLINALGDWVVDRAIRDAVSLNASPGPSRYVSINIAARQARQHHFVNTFRDHLNAHGLDPTHLVIEITEDVFVADDAQVWSYLEELRDLGIRVAIDDYGTGHASASYLRQPNVDIVKTDKSFTAEPHGPRDRILLEAITWACTRLGLDQIAEGVEDVATRDALLELGCRYAQGFLYAPALALDQAVACRQFGEATSRADRHVEQFSM
jgi:diguanylate cyclase (GGDEF)-like protein